MSIPVAPPTLPVLFAPTMPEATDGASKLGRAMPCISCAGEAVTINLRNRGGLAIEEVECPVCELRYQRVNL